MRGRPTPAVAVRRTLAALSLAVLAAAAAPAAAEPRLPPAGSSLLVFVCQAGEQWDLFAWDPAGGEAPRRLTDTPPDELSPSLSADRRRLVHTDSAGVLWTVELASGERRRRSGDDETNRLLQPAFAPGGESFLAVHRADRARDVTDLVVREAGAAGGGAEGVVLGPAWEALDARWPTRRLPMLSSQFSPAWAPDGRRFAFTNLHARWTGSIVSEIWEARADHSVARQLTLLDAFCDEPAWSPAGDEIAFACDRPDQLELYAVALADREVRRLTSHPAADTSPVYAPDGRSLAFVSTRGGAPALYLLDLEGGGVEPLRPFADGRPCKDPDWR